MESNTELKNLISLFEIKGSPVSLEKYGNGHINDTYLLVTEKDGKRTIAEGTCIECGSCASTCPVGAISK